MHVQQFRSVVESPECHLARELRLLEATDIVTERESIPEVPDQHKLKRT